MDRPFYYLRTVILSIICFVSISAAAQYCCNANFTYSGTGGSSYVFIPTDSSFNEPTTSWLWEFGNGYSSNEQYPTTQFQYPGDYLVTLTKQSVYFDSSDSIVSTCSISKRIHIDSISDPGCNAEFFYSLAGKTALFYSEDNTAFLESWSFGDGFTSYDQNPLHSYSYPGAYTVCRQIYKDSVLLTAMDTSSQISCEVCKTIVITDSLSNDSCNANFYYSTYGNTASFYTSYSDFNYWSFGDGNYSYDQNPTYVYTTPGTYLVTHNAIRYDSLQNFVDSCSSQQYIYIASIDTCNAGFTSSNDNYTITFYPNNYVDYNYWTFGDGNYSYDANPSHTYSAPGSYLVSRFVISFDSLQNLTDSCYSQHYIYVIPTVDSCNASFTTSTSGYTASFYGTNSDFNYWSFGDGNYSYDVTPVHTYSGPGNYLVSRFVASYDSLQNVTDSCYSEQYIYIAPIVDSCNAAFTSSTSGFTASFYATEPGTDNIWSFGDGSYSYIANPIHNYSAPGNYLVTRTVFTYDSAQYSIDTCYSQEYIYIASILDSCNAGFSSETIARKVTFTSYNENGYGIWDFGDGQFSTAKNPTHTYTSFGNYLVTRTVITYDSLQHILDTCQSTNYIYIAPIADSCNAGFTYSFRSDTIFVQANEAKGQHSWNFGDGAEDKKGANIYHVYNGNGNFTVCHTTDSCSECQEVVLEKPIVLPNPSNDVLNIQCNSGNLDYYFLYDSYGNTIASQFNIQRAHISINTSNIPAGQYYLQVRYASGSYSNYKIVIQH